MTPRVRPHDTGGSTTFVDVGKTLANWAHRARHGKLSQDGESHHLVIDLEVEVPRLKRELAEARMERDTLKMPLFCWKQ